ncbi:MAG: hypothetical protein R3266_05210 [Gemmatimonadota bacterium]|nr:hypothetical protein [Gemmatimonadota bacterium]
MIRAVLVLLTVGVVGVAVTGVVFSLLLPLLLLALKAVFFVGIAYLILRMVNPEMADRWKERCCGPASTAGGAGHGEGAGEGS